MAKRRKVDSEELLRIDKALRETPGLEELRTTVTDRTLVAIRSAAGRRGSASASYTLRASGSYETEIFTRREHFSWHGGIKDKHSTDAVIAHIQDHLIDYLNSMVGA